MCVRACRAARVPNREVRKGSGRPLVIANVQQSNLMRTAKVAKVIQGKTEKKSPSQFVLFQRAEGSSTFKEKLE